MKKGVDGEHMLHTICVWCRDDHFSDGILGLIPLLFLLLLNLFLLLAQNDPVVLVVVLIATLLEQILEHVSQEVVVWLFLKLQVPDVHQVLHKLIWIALAQGLDGCRQLLFFYPLVLVFLVVSLETLPWQHASKEVQGNIADRLQIVSPAYDKFNGLLCSTPRCVLMEAYRAVPVRFFPSL